VWTKNWGNKYRWGNGSIVGSGLLNLLVFLTPKPNPPYSIWIQLRVEPATPLPSHHSSSHHAMNRPRPFTRFLVYIFSVFNSFNSKLQISCIDTINQPFIIFYTFYKIKNKSRSKLPLINRYLTKRKQKTNILYKFSSVCSL